MGEPATDRAARTVRAFDGVRAQMVDDSKSDLAAGESAEPVRVQAREATWTDLPRSFRFEEDVRAWQGENYLVARTLALEGDDLVGEGNVRSVWHQRAPETPADDGTAAEEPPIQISSTSMRFERDSGRLTYDGSARVVQGARTMACPQLQVQLDDNEDFERFYCEAGTTIDDGVAGNRLTGDAAIYNNAASKVRIVGDPAKLVQADGGTISARLMVYDFDTAIAEIDSVAAADADLFLTASEYFAARRVESQEGGADAGGVAEGVAGQPSPATGRRPADRPPPDGPRPDPPAGDPPPRDPPRSESNVDGGSAADTAAGDGGGSR